LRELAVDVWVKFGDGWVARALVLMGRNGLHRFGSLAHSVASFGVAHYEERSANQNGTGSMRAMGRGNGR
jgi:hypothetical protein